MTVVQPNSIAGINSISVQSGQSLSIHKSDGTLIREIVASTGISTFSSISVGSATTTNSAGKSINIGLGASISQHADNTLSFGTNGNERARFDSSGRLLINKTSGSFGLEVGAGSDSTFRITNVLESSHGSHDAKIVAGGSYYQNPNIIGSAIKFSTYNGSAEGERARIDSSGRVLIGTTDAGDSTADDLTIANSAVCGITIRSGTSSEGNIFFADGTSGDSRYRGMLRYDHNVDAMILKVTGTERLRITSTGTVQPGADATQDFGSISKRWANIYSADLQLSNKGSENEVDGSWGSYTIQEGESDLFLINRRNGKKYKFNLTEVS